VSTYTLGGEKQILDRVTQWGSFPDEQLRSIIAADPGTERAEAAKRILASRGSPTVVVPTGSISVQLPSSVQTRYEVMPPAFDLKNPLVLGGIAAGAVLLGLLLTKGRG
jgi:hypothetical protein